jgi:hypothetical protein
MMRLILGEGQTLTGLRERLAAERARNDRTSLGALVFHLKS